VNVGVICFESHWERRDLATKALLEAAALGKVLAFPDVDSSPRKWAS
jgi:hypothetical protein